jgi:hypothetical protein
MFSGSLAEADLLIKVSYSVSRLTCYDTYIRRQPDNIYIGKMEVTVYITVYLHCLPLKLV